MRSRRAPLILWTVSIFIMCNIPRASFSSPPAAAVPGADRVKPEPLRPGDLIAIVAPSYPMDPPGRIQLAIQRLRERGYRVKEAPNLYTRYGYLAGDDEARAAALMDAFRDPEVKAVFPGTGGYGLSRILDRLDWAEIARHPKIVIGFSDITALHLALDRRLGWITFHSPNPMWGLGNDEGMNPLAERWFWRALEEPRYFDPPPPGWHAFSSGWTFDLDGVTSAPRTLAAGIGCGRLIGGNLSLIAALMGTPYEIETQGRIVFFEDVGEAPYRIDRMFAQLEMAGKFNAPAGVILGRWHKCVADDPEKSLTLDQVFERYFAGRPYPVVADFPIGHVTENVTLPIGALAELHGATCSLRLLEDPVNLRSAEKSPAPPAP